MTLNNMVSISDFNHVCFIKPELDSDGHVMEYQPQSKYENKKNYKLNKYGKGSFCKFKIPKGYVGKKGVYLILVNDNIQYVGKCEDLESRYNMGYGIISPRNCFEGGQNTNCKINSLILSEFKKGSKIELKFHKTDNHSLVETELIKQINPKWNGSISVKIRN